MKDTSNPEISCGATQRPKRGTILHRNKKLIKVRAFQFASGEIEAILLSTLAIGYRTPDEPGTEFPRTHVVRSPGKAGEHMTE